MENKEKQQFLECERWWTLAVLMYIGGFFGGYTYSARGGVFCNAQTANFVLLAISISSGDWHKAGYLCIPITAYFLGTVISESVATSVRKMYFIRWDTLLIFIEMLTVFILGLIPDSAPYAISQVAVNFIASMQYNTFRQADGIPVATTFCTNHVRQVGIAFAKAFRHKDKTAFRRMWFHAGMLALFVSGGISSAMACAKFSGKGVWFALLPLTGIFIDLLHADLKTEKNQLDKIPKGH